MEKTRQFGKTSEKSGEAYFFPYKLLIIDQWFGNKFNEFEKLDCNLLPAGFSLAADRYHGLLPGRIVLGRGVYLNGPVEVLACQGGVARGACQGGDLQILGLNKNGIGNFYACLATVI